MVLTAALGFIPGHAARQSSLVLLDHRRRLVRHRSRMAVVLAKKVTAQPLPKTRIKLEKDKEWIKQATNT